MTQQLAVVVFVSFPFFVSRKPGVDTVVVVQSVQRYY